LGQTRSKELPDEIIIVPGRQCNQRKQGQDESQYLIRHGDTQDSSLYFHENQPSFSSEKLFAINFNIWLQEQLHYIIKKLRPTALFLLQGQQVVLIGIHYILMMKIYSKN